MIKNNYQANFSAGPSQIPFEVMDRFRKEIPEYYGQHISMFEQGHRTPKFQNILEEIKSTLSQFFCVPSTHEMIFIQGGARTQFGMLPLSFRHTAAPSYIVSGLWSQKAHEDALRVGQANLLWSGKERSYHSLPLESDIKIPADTAYIYLCSNETVNGNQLPKTFLRNSSNSIPVAVDASSDILSHKVDFDHVDFYYACAQKNAGISGMTVVIAKKAFLAKMNSKGLPEMMDYNNHVRDNSCLNTSPVVAIYFFKLMLDWLEERYGSIDRVEEANRQKADLIYSTLDRYQQHIEMKVDKTARSIVNVVFSFKDQKGDQHFLEEAEKIGWLGLKGHRSCGGIRVSMYNTQTIQVMESFNKFLDGYLSKL